MELGREFLQHQIDLWEALLEWDAHAPAFVAEVALQVTDDRPHRVAHERTDVRVVLTECSIVLVDFACNWSVSGYVTVAAARPPRLAPGVHSGSKWIRETWRRPHPRRHLGVTATFALLRGSLLAAVLEQVGAYGSCEGRDQHKSDYECRQHDQAT